MMPVKGPSEGFAPFWEEFEVQYEIGGFWIGIWHPFLTGRLALWRQVDNWLETVLARGDVWFAPLHEISVYVTSQRATTNIRIDQFPYYDGPVLTKR